MQLLVDFALVLLPWIVVRHVHISAHRKNVILFCFGTRLTVIVAVVAQLVYFNKAAKSDDMPFNSWSEVVCSQIVQSLSVITACVPQLKRFFDSIESGMIRNDDLRRRGLASGEMYAASTSRQASLAAGPMKQSTELNAHLDELAGRSANNGRGAIPIGIRSSQ